MKSKLKRANPPRELTPYKTDRRRARARVTKFAKAFFLEWLAEPHPAAPAVIQEAVSMLWPELHNKLLPVRPPPLNSKKSFFNTLEVIKVSKLNNLVELFSSMMISRGTPLHGPAGSPTVRLRPVSQGEVEMTYTMPESELPTLISIQAANAIKCLPPL